MKQITLRSLVFLLGVFFSLSANADEQCMSLPIEACLGDQLISLIEKSDLLNEKQKRFKKNQVQTEIFLSNPNNSRKRINPKYSSPQDKTIELILSKETTEGIDLISDDLLAATPLEILYHRSLIHVQPNKTAFIKEQILNQIAHLPSQKQSIALTDLALIEGFSGAPREALETIQHALKSDPENKITNIVYYTLKSSQEMIDSTTKNLGYQQTACTRVPNQIALSLTSSMNDESMRLYQLIDAIPSPSLKLKTLFLVSTFINSLNPCQFQSSLYDYKVLKIIKLLNDEKDAFELGLQSLRAYRRYQ